MLAALRDQLLQPLKRLVRLRSLVAAVVVDHLLVALLDLVAVAQVARVMEVRVPPQLVAVAVVLTAQERLVLAAQVSS